MWTRYGSILHAVTSTGCVANGGGSLGKQFGAAWGRRKRLQCAALPLEPGSDFPKVLLVTTRRSGHWVIPKGWAEPDLLPHLLAGREAFEEAGVFGEVEPVPIGEYTYRKRMSDGHRVPCRVTVFSMTVLGFAEVWPERGQRRSLWVSLDEAAVLVKEPGLAGFLRQIASSPTAHPRQRGSQSGVPLG